MSNCECKSPHPPARRVVLTGGPGGGKTAVLEVVRKNFCEHVHVLPEAATILFSGGFPRVADLASRRAVQRAIFHVQQELEEQALGESKYAVILCDRGTVDGLAYWPGEPPFFPSVGSTEPAELARYAAVIHLRTPAAGQGYNHVNPSRVESAEEATQIDGRIAEVWARHPRRMFIPSTDSFLKKLVSAVDAIREEVPACCRHHQVAELSARVDALSKH